MIEDLYDVIGDCMWMLEELGIEYYRYAKFELFDSTRFYGQCWNYGDGRCVIKLNKALLSDSVKMEALEEIILHELLHSVDGGNGHTGLWKRLADKVNTVYGCNISRTISEKYVGVKISVKKEPKYVFKCRGCGQIVKYYRASKFVKHPESFGCGICHGNFEQIK